MLYCTYQLYIHLQDALFQLGFSLLARHLLTMSTKFGFSKAAATRSLSFNCLLTASSVECVPGVTFMSTCEQQNISI